MIRSAAPSLRIERVGGEGLDDALAIIDCAFDPRFGEAWTRAQCAGILPMSGVSLLIARQVREPLGFSLSRHVADEAELLLLAVVPQSRGQGIASALLDRFIADHAAIGAHHLHLEVREGNPAVNLYRQRNFNIAGRRRQYYRGPGGEMFDALTMTRKV